MRQLATIENIREIKPHNNADSLELATVRGWQVVVGKNQFKVGDLCVFFEIDSLLPIRPEFEFLRKMCWRKLDNGLEGFRLRTALLRKEISQGLAMPLKDCPQLTDVDNLKVGDDITSILDVVLYDPPIAEDLKDSVKGQFPSYISKTDQSRIQNFWDKLKSDYSELDFEVTIKLDGTSATYYYKDGILGACNRSLDFILPESIEDMDEEQTRNLQRYLRVGKQQGFFAALKRLGKNIALQCELCGPKIQKNHDRLETQKAFIFDIFDIDSHRYYSPTERYTLLKDLGISIAEYHVPILSSVKAASFETIQDLLEFANGSSITAKTREGVVLKALSRDRVSFKVISNQFLISEKD